MRLIDADACEPYFYEHLDDNGVAGALNAIDEMPTIEPKKGRWKRRLVDSGFNADWHCSECGWKTSLEEHGYNFCPSCGADMRAEVVRVR